MRVKGERMKPGTERALGKWKQARSCPPLPCTTPLYPPCTTGAGNSESAPQLCSKVLDAALRRQGGSSPPLPVPQAQAASWLPAPSRGQWKNTSGRAGCVTLGKSVRLSGPLALPPAGAEMRIGGVCGVGNFNALRATGRPEPARVSGGGFSSIWQMGKLRLGRGSHAPKVTQGERTRLWVCSRPEGQKEVQRREQGRAGRAERRNDRQRDGRRDMGRHRDPVAS